MRIRGSTSVKILLMAFLIITVILPLFCMLIYMTGVDISAIIGSVQFNQALKNSILSAGTGTIITITAAYILAVCIVRTNMRFREIFGVFATLPMLIPSISHGMGLILLLGSNGILTQLLGIKQSVYGFNGIVLGSVFYAFPVAFLMLSDILKYEDGSPYEAAAVLGIPRSSQFFFITIPYLRKPLIAVVFTVFTLIFTDYGVPLMVGGRFATLPVLMYQEVIGLLDFNRGSVIGSFLLIPAIIAFLFDILSRDTRNQNFTIQEKNKNGNAIRDGVAIVYTILICFIIVLPLIIFVILTFVNKYPVDLSFSLTNIEKTLNMNAGKYLINSLIIALGVSTLGTILSYSIAYFTARTPGKTSKILHLISITSLAIPGLVLGLSYVLFFKGSLLYGTFVILVLVNIIHFLASPYLMAYNSLCKVNANLEDVGLTLGISRFFVIKDCLVPQTKLTIFEMFSYFFINSMMTISAISFLNTVKNKPISLMITQFEAQLFLEGAAFVSLLILVCNFTVKFLFYILRKKLSN